MRRAIFVVLAALASGCSGSGTGGSSGGGNNGGNAGGNNGGNNGGGTCATALCGGTCCAAGDSCIDNACCPAAQSCGATCCSSGAECVKDQAGNQACGVICQTNSDCGAGAPCCIPVSNQNGGFSGNGVCGANPTASNPYACLCKTSAECGGECVPDVNNSGAITGPYICAPNSGGSNAGCAGALTVCSVANQYCSTDREGNEFCSIACTSDALCGNPGVACCNTTCTDGTCCGLCGS